MAEKRMFTKKITDGDQFTSLPPTAQCLYFHLCMSADDEGFTNTIRKAMFNAHAGIDDLNLLTQKRFLIPFDSGVVVIKHWRIHNTIKKDRFHPTEWIDEKGKLFVKENGVYTEQNDDVDPFCIQDVSRMEPEIRLDKNRLDKNRLDKNSNKARPTLEEVKTYCQERKNNVDAEKWFDYYSSNGWKVGRNPMNDWKASVRTWEKNSFNKPNKSFNNLKKNFTSTERNISQSQMDELEQKLLKGGANA